MTIFNANLLRLYLPSCHRRITSIAITAAIPNRLQSRTLVESQNFLFVPHVHCHHSVTMSMPAESVDAASYRLHSTLHYTSHHIEPDADPLPVFERAANAVKGKFRRYPVSKFLNLLPQHDGMPKVEYVPFKKLVEEARKEKDLYDLFIESMQPYLKKGWKLINCSNSSDANSQTVWGDYDVKPDMGLYGPGLAPNEDESLCDVSNMTSPGEFKYEPEDEPFRVDKKKKGNPKKKGRQDEKPFEHDNSCARNTRGQLTVYLNAVQANQLRTRTFMFYVRKQYCRLLCHSRAGILVTPLFDYTKTDHLQTFFWRLTHASPAQRGIDDTFRPVPLSDNSDDVLRARKVLELASMKSLYKILIPEASGDYRATDSSHLPAGSSAAPTLRTFYVSEPFTSSHLYPLGRGGRCFSAYDPLSGTIVLLKDVWRVTGYHPEAETYKKLHQFRVPRVPDVLAFGDVEHPLHKCGGGDGLRSHVHYRIVLSQVGRPLSTFSSTHQLSKIISDAIDTHRCAWEDAGVLHRDISYGNIIIYKGEGWLIDWELARWDKGEDKDTEPRASERTGTWQFLSIRILKDPKHHHEPRDDLESFIYLLLWLAVKYAPSGLSDIPRARLLKKFDYQKDDPAYDKLSMVDHGGQTIVTPNSGVKLATKAFESLLFDLLEKLKAIYASKEPELRQVLTHVGMLEVFRKALNNQEWQNTNDSVVDHQGRRDKGKGVGFHEKNARKRKYEDDDVDDNDDDDEIICVKKVRVDDGSEEDTGEEDEGEHGDGDYEVKNEDNGNDEADDDDEAKDGD